MLNTSVGRVQNITETGANFTTNRTLKNNEKEER